jgi:hypothetical protein
MPGNNLDKALDVLREGNQAPVANQLDHPAENAGTRAVFGAMNRTTR